MQRDVLMEEGSDEVKRERPEMDGVPVKVTNCQSLQSCGVDWTTPCLDAIWSWELSIFHPTTQSPPWNMEVWGFVRRQGHGGNWNACAVSVTKEPLCKDPAVCQVRIPPLTPRGRGGGCAPAGCAVTLDRAPAREALCQVQTGQAVLTRGCLISGRLPSAAAEWLEHKEWSSSSCNRRLAGTGLIQVCSNSIAQQTKGFCRESNITLENDGFLPPTLKLTLQRPDLMCIKHSPKKPENILWVCSYCISFFWLP